MVWSKWINDLSMCNSQMHFDCGTLNVAIDCGLVCEFGILCDVHIYILIYIYMRQMRFIWLIRNGVCRPWLSGRPDPSINHHHHTVFFFSQLKLHSRITSCTVDCGVGPRQCIKKNFNLFFFSCFFLCFKYSWLNIISVKWVFWRCERRMNVQHTHTHSNSALIAIHTVLPYILCVTSTSVNGTDWCCQSIILNDSLTHTPHCVRIWLLCVNNNAIKICVCLCAVDEFRSTLSLS